MTEQDAGSKLESPEPTMAQMTAELVRDRAKTEAKLTPVSALAYEGKMLDSEQQAELLAEIAADDQCSDVKLMRTSSGAAYLYSTGFMSDTYARILLRVEDGNPYETIASTVREESQVYPRPTSLAMLKDGAFGLDPDQVERLVREVVQLPQYSDLKLVEASTGALYIYSERHLNGDWAESLVEWEEVGKFSSP
jgi:hypothetical protein